MGDWSRAKYKCLEGVAGTSGEVHRPQSDGCPKAKIADVMKAVAVLLGGEESVTESSASYLGIPVTEHSCIVTQARVG